MVSTFRLHLPYSTVLFVQSPLLRHVGGHKVSAPLHNSVQSPLLGHVDGHKVSAPLHNNVRSPLLRHVDGHKVSAPLQDIRKVWSSMLRHLGLFMTSPLLNSAREFHLRAWRATMARVGSRHGCPRSPRQLAG